MDGCQAVEVAMVFSSFYCIAMQLLGEKSVKKLFVCFIDCKLLKESLFVFTLFVYTLGKSGLQEAALFKVFIQKNGTN